MIRFVAVCYTRMSIARTAFATIMSARPSSEVCSATDDVGGQPLQPEAQSAVHVQHTSCCKGL